MCDGMTIYLIEEVDTSKEYHDDTQEIGTEEEAHDHYRDDNSCCDSVPFFPSFEFVFKCPRKFFHKLQVIDKEIDDEPSRP